VPVVLGDVRSLARRGFSLADSGLYQDVVDKGCEVAHGARVRARAKVRVRTAVMQVSLGGAFLVTWAITRRFLASFF
jgi:hypothetical protein